MQPRRRPPSDRRRLLDKLFRELCRSEARTLEHGPREQRRIGSVSPVAALHDVARHAAQMQPRLAPLLADHGFDPPRAGLASTLTTTLRHVVHDRAFDAERSYRDALLDLRHGIDVVRVLREAARLEELFAVIRWCDDWLAVRIPLVANVESGLGWFATRPRSAGAAPAADPAARDIS